MSFLVVSVLGCAPAPELPPAATHAPPEPETTEPVPSTWDELGPCEAPTATSVVPPPVATDCRAAGPAWTSGDVAGRAHAHVTGAFQLDTLGVSLVTVDSDGDGRDGLLISAPGHGYPESTGTRSAESVRVYLLDAPAGEVVVGDAQVVAGLGPDMFGNGAPVAVLGPTGPGVIGEATAREGASIRVVDLGTGDTSVLHSRDTDNCGASLATGDVDGDGATDILTACLRGRTDTWPGFVGALSRASGDWRPALRIEGSAPAIFGIPSLGGFDLDRDGVADLAVTEQVYPATLLHLISGPRTGACTLAEADGVTLDGDPGASWRWFGQPLTHADLDGDGADDLVVPTFMDPSPDPGTPGAVYVIRDWPTEDGPLGAASRLVLEDPDPGDVFGASMAVGDFNDDGCPDLAVGAPGDRYQQRAGRVFVFDGPLADGTLDTADADVVLDGPAPEDGFGWRVAAGDFDGDGIDDLAIAAPWEDGAALDSGAVYVLAGAAGSSP